MTTDMSVTIIAKSDQLNADDLIGGPLTVRIARVAIAPEAEQPVSVGYDGDAGKPFKPCKLMRRVMIHAWGADAGRYIGQSMTLYRDPSVKFGGMQVGGIRISHMTGLASPMTVPLKISKAKQVLFTVTPLIIAAPTEAPKRRTAQDFLDAVAADLRAAQTADAVAAIVARDDVVKASSALKGQALEALNALIGDAGQRFMPALPVDDDGWTDADAGGAP